MLIKCPIPRHGRALGAPGRTLGSSVRPEQWSCCARVGHLPLCWAHDFGPGNWVIFENSRKTIIRIFKIKKYLFFSYRSQAEVAAMRKERDPISHFRAKILEQGLVEEEELQVSAVLFEKLFLQK
jgi:hypothetical protein